MGRIFGRPWVVLLLATGLLPQIAEGQTETILAEEKAWGAGFQAFGSPFAYDNWETYELVRDNLKQKLVDLLALDPGMSYQFDSLDQHIAVLQSPDKRLRICSWDERSGGSMHDMATLAQYLDAAGKVHYAWLDPDMIAEERETDALFSRLYQLSDEAGQSLYLLIGWGTYGSGHHHYSARLLQIKGERLMDVPAAFNDSAFLEVLAPRSMRVEMTFDPESRTLIHREFVMNPEIGFMEQTGRWVAWVFEGGKFFRQ